MNNTIKIVKNNGMKTITHSYKNRDRKASVLLTSVLLIPASMQGATVMITLNSQDRIVGAHQSSGDALGYYTDKR